MYNERDFLTSWHKITQDEFCPVGYSSKIHQLLLCIGLRHPTNECPGYDTKQSDGEVPVMLEF